MVGVSRCQSVSIINDPQPGRLAVYPPCFDDVHCWHPGAHPSLAVALPPSSRTHILPLYVRAAVLQSDAQPVDSGSGWGVSPHVLYAADQSSPYLGAIAVEKLSSADPAGILLVPLVITLPDWFEDQDNLPVLTISLFIVSFLIFALRKKLALWLGAPVILPEAANTGENASIRLAGLMCSIRQQQD